MIGGWYPYALLILLLAGLVPGLVFLATHRPRQWRRIAAWDASGWVVVVALLYARSLVLTVMRWPIPLPDATNGWIGLATLAGIDLLLIIRLVSYAAFVERDRRLAVTPER